MASMKNFIDNFSVDTLIINGDQMPLHRNESVSQKTLNIILKVTKHMSKRTTLFLLKGSLHLPRCLAT